MFAIYEGTTGAKATAADAVAYARYLGITDFPVMADGDLNFVAVTPMTQESHPEVCAIAPDLRVISCYSGHGSYETALDDIRRRAGK